MKLAAAARPAKLDVRSLTKANLDASGVADASPLSARSKLRRFASTSDLPPAIQPPRTNGQSVVDAGAAAVVLLVRSFGRQLRVFPGVCPRRRLVERPAQPRADDDAI